MIPPGSASSPGSDETGKDHPSRCLDTRMDDSFMFRLQRSFLSTLMSISIVATLSACAVNPTTNRTEVVDALHPDAVTEISTDVGTAVTLTLPGNAGTGYEWVLASPLPEFLQQRGASKFVAKDSSKVGSQGDTEFVLEAIAAGKATVRFHYLRSWKKDARPARWAEAAITVKSSGG